MRVQSPFGLITLGTALYAAAALAVTAHAGAAVERVGWASAAVFAGPSWDELGSEAAVPPVDDRQRSSDFDELKDRLRSLPGWTRRRILTAQFVDVRMHVVRRLVRDVIDQLRRREAAKAALLELGGEVRRVHLELGRRLEAGRGQPRATRSRAPTPETDGLPRAPARFGAHARARSHAVTPCCVPLCARRGLARAWLTTGSTVVSK